MSGIYNDFPDWPTTFHDFAAEDPQENTELTIAGTKVKILNYNKEVEVVFQGTNVMNCKSPPCICTETSIKKPPPYMPPCKIRALQLRQANNSILGNSEE
ncbi:hypothetical protein CRG98_021562 [Punica granatum]|uniref:Uncharacterized protein n=1 Tax=Punica granatum TaxID=22663 RepID=A0A2I0JP61_PUNGR|nr:hypothetical protein CRG98_021562 [Punica granatum]